MASGDQHPGKGPFVLGIDAGGTKTVCLLADGDGRILAEARGTGANLQAAGELQVEKVLHDVMERALGDRDILPVAICLGIAGVDREDDAGIVRALMRRIGYKARILVTNDALIALVAALGDAPGVVVIAGTGSIAYGRNAHGQAARAGGWGYVLADEGSGYWIGRQALRAVVRQADGRGPATALTPRVLLHFAARRPEELVQAIYSRHLQPAAIAAVAHTVEDAADQHDPIAVEILSTAARELATCAASVVRQLDLQDQAFAFVLAGGILQSLPRLAAAVAEHLEPIAPRSRVTRLDREAACGAVELARAEAGGGARIPAYRAS